MPKDKKNLPKKQFKRGNLPLPLDVIEELRQWKLSYEIAWSDPAPNGKQYTMTYEQLIRRLLEGVKRLDPEVWATHRACNKSREEQMTMMADFRKNFWGELFDTKTKLDGLFKDVTVGDSPTVGQEPMKEKEAPSMNPSGTYPVDPTESEVWNMKYFFENDEGKRLDAHVGDIAPFYCKLNGRDTGMKTMMKKGWKLMNDVGVELTEGQAKKLSDILKKHKV